MNAAQRVRPYCAAPTLCLTPLLMPTTLFVLVNSTINSFKLVDHIFILTKGAPDNSTVTAVSVIYREAFQRQRVANIGASSTAWMSTSRTEFEWR